ncbi:MAG TPA: outer membrane beta-barrel protein [Cyclobacteriaceae bacterium]|jgi:hypothetical protein|nr:outer membrane beta-barrel protein [Cyclobacteriaceae bacterium]
MWRISVSLLALQCIFTLHSKAQLLVGPVAGVGVSKVFFFDNTVYDHYKTSPSINLDGGIMASMVVHKNYVLNAQLLYSYRTKHVHGVSEPHADPLYDFSSRMNYIELPIFYVLEFKSQSGNASGHGGRVKTYNWFVGGGPTISYWLSSKSRLSSSNLQQSYIDHVDYTTVFGSDPQADTPRPMDFNQEYIPDANRWQFGINITGGLAFEPVGLHKIVTFAQFNIAQTFFAKSDVTLPTLDVDVLRSKNHIFKISMAYLFDTKISTSKKGKSTKGKEGQKRRR